MLKFRDIDTHTPTTDLVAVTNDVILLCTHFQWISIKQTHMLIIHTREGIVLGIIALQVLIVVKEWEVYHPAERHFISIDELQAFRKFGTQAEENIIANLSAIGNKEQQITRLALQPINDRLYLIWR